MRLKVEVGRFSPATTEILPKNRLNVGRGFTPRRKNSSAGYKTLPYKKDSARRRLALRKISEGRALA